MIQIGEGIYIVSMFLLSNSLH